MAKIFKREWTTRGPTGRRVRHLGYGYTVMISGQRERRFSAEWRSEAEALEALSGRLKEVEAGQVERVQKPTRTLIEVTQEYLVYKEQQGKRTVKDDKRILENRMLPYFGKALPVRGLSTEAIAQYEKERIGTVSAYTVSNELTVLRHLLRLAKKWGYLDRVPEIELPKKPEGRTRYLTQEEIGRLLKACAQSRNPYLLAIVILAINTGMRKGEILKLDWARVDLGADLGFNARITLYDTKNGKPRGVPLNRAAIEALARTEPNPDNRTGPVFKARDGVAWGKIRTAFELAVQRAEIPGFRFHDLRHTAASWMVMKGRNLKEVQEVLGHRDFRMTNRYAHLSPAHLRTTVEALDGLTAMPSDGHTADQDLAHKLAHNAEPEVAKNLTN